MSNKDVILAKRNTRVWSLNFENAPSLYGNLKGFYKEVDFFGEENYFLIIKLMHKDYHYYPTSDVGKLIEVREVVPSKAVRWLQRGLKFVPKPYQVLHETLPEYVRVNGEFKLKV